MSLVLIDKTKLLASAKKVDGNSNCVAFLNEVVTSTNKARTDLKGFHTSFGMSVGELQTNRDNRLVQHRLNTTNVLVAQSENLADVLENIVTLADRAETEAYRLLGGDVSGQGLDLLNKLKKTKGDANIDLDSCKTTQEYITALNNGSTTPAALASYLAASGVGSATTVSILSAYLNQTNKKLPSGKTKEEYISDCMTSYTAQKEACAETKEVGSSSAGARNNTQEVFKASDAKYNTGAKDQVPGLPMNYAITTYMPYSKIADGKSWQYGIREDTFDKGGYTYIDENGLYRSAKTAGVKSNNDYYIVAMGSGFNKAANKLDSTASTYTGNGTWNRGYTFKVTLTADDGTLYTADVMCGDVKDDKDSLTPHNNLLEFITKDGGPSSNISDTGGNVALSKLVGTSDRVEISSVAAYESGSRYVGSYKPNGWKHNPAEGESI